MRVTAVTSSGALPPPSGIPSRGIRFAPDMTEPNITVSDAPGESRFEVHFEGELAGFADYRLRPDRIVFTHTEVDDRFQGHGLAGRLARFGLGAARERGLRVTPLCPYIAGWIKKHPEYVDLVDEAHLDLVT